MYTVFAVYIKYPTAIPAAAERQMMIMGWTFLNAITTETPKIAREV